MRKESEGADLTAEQAKAADSGVKAMISIGRPFLDYVISALADGGVTDVCLVIGPEHDMIRDYYDNVDKSRVNITYAVQEEPLGTADAVLAAEDFAGQDSILVLNSDNYYPVSGYRALVDLPGNGLVGFDRAALFEKSNIESDRVAAFALAVSDEDGNMVDIVEKPDPGTIAALGPDAAVSMNLWKFTPAIFDAARRIEKSPRGEYEIQDAVRKVIAEGGSFAVIPSSEGVLDMSNRDDIASVQDALTGVEVSL